jgi:hypothetical protein
VTSKYRGCQGRIDFLGAHIFELSVKDKVIALGTEIDGSLFSQKNERENISILNIGATAVRDRACQSNGGITYLCAAVEKEFVGVNPVANGASNKWEPVEDDRRLIGIFEEDLSQNVQNNGNNNDGE